MNPYATTFFYKSYASYFDMQRLPIAIVHNYSPQQGVCIGQIPMNLKCVLIAKDQFQHTFPKKKKKN